MPLPPSSLACVISFYLVQDKFVQKQHYSIRVFHAGKRLSFSEFVDKVTFCVGDEDCRAKNHGKAPGPEGLHSKTNPHWRPQIYMCQLEKYLQLFNFVGSVEFGSVHVKALFDDLGLWAPFGAHGWGRDKTEAFLQYNRASHKTGSHDKLGKYYTPELLARVREAYAMDYKMMELIGLVTRTGPHPNATERNELIVTGEAWGHGRSVNALMNWAPPATMGVGDRLRRMAGISSRPPLGSGRSGGIRGGGAKRQPSTRR